MQNSISVIVPVYNTFSYLEEAVDSILLQKDSILEIIIINDGSTDGSGELLNELYSSVSIIKIIHTKNNGQGYARNIGIIEAKGDFIYCFDSDDILLPELFERFYEKLNTNLDLELFCFSGDSFLDPEYTSTKVKNPSVLSENAYKRKVTSLCFTGEKAFQLLVQNESFFPGPPLYIFKKSICTNNNVKFKSIRYEDEEFTVKLFLEAGKTYITNNVYFKRRVRADSTMQLQKNFNDILGYIKNIESAIKLKTKPHIEQETYKLLEKRILNFVKTIIIIKTAYKISMSNEEKKYLNKCIKSILWKNPNILSLYYKYPIEYGLRKLKSKLMTRKINV